MKYGPHTRSAATNKYTWKDQSDASESDSCREPRFGNTVSGVLTVGTQKVTWASIGLGRVHGLADLHRSNRAKRPAWELHGGL
jgi:hypothetical protein